MHFPENMDKTNIKEGPCQALVSGQGNEVYPIMTKITNVSAEDEDVAELMEFFKNSNGMNGKFKNLSDRVGELKNEESEVLAMCKLVEGYAKEYAKEQNRTQAIEFALDLIAENVFSIKKIAKLTGLSVEEVRDLRPQKL